MAVVLLRKTLTSKDDSTQGQKIPRDRDPARFWNKINAKTRKTAMTEFLVAIKEERLSSVRKKLCDAVSDLCLYLAAHHPNVNLLQQWPELMPFLFTLAQSTQEGHRAAALNVFAKLALYVGDSVKVHGEVLKGVLVAGLKDANSLEVRLAALAASVSFVQLLETKQEKLRFKDFTPLMFEACLLLLLLLSGFGFSPLHRLSDSHSCHQRQETTRSSESSSDSGRIGRGRPYFPATSPRHRQQRYAHDRAQPWPPRS